MRQFYIPNFFLVLTNSQIQIEVIDQEAWIILIELWNEFFEAGWILHNVVPISLDAFEKPVRFIEPTTLQFEHILWPLANKVTNHVTWCRIVASIHEARFWHVVIAFQKSTEPIFVKSTNRLR